MASASSLLGLVSQLQSLESSFAAILMEAAMKLANLTDANIFFLVETPQGRKFSGKRHLCDLYVGGELAPVGDDVEFEIDPSISAIHERIVAGGGGGGEGGLEEYGVDDAFDAGDSFLDDDFFSFQGEASTTSSWKAPPPNSSSQHQHSSFPTSSRKSKRPVISNGTMNSPVKRFKSINCKMEPVFDGQRPNNIDNPSATPSKNGNSGAGGKEAYSVPFTDSAASGNDGSHAGAHHSAANSVNGAVAPSISSNHITNGELFETGGEYDVSVVANSMLPEAKVTAFAGIVDPSVYVKGSVQNRLAVSVCYDFGKILAELRPPNLSNEGAKAFLKANFDRWVLQYGNLRSFLDVMIPNGNPEKGVQYSVMGMFRKAARSGYGCSKKNRGSAAKPYKDQPQLSLEYRLLAPKENESISWAG